MKLHIGSILVEIVEDNIHIHDSYKITSNKEKIAALNEIFNIVPKFPRSYKSALRE